MSTRCLIGKMGPDGTIRAIRCFHDGYPDGVGYLLNSNYWEEEEIDELLAIGDVSALDSSPYRTKVYDALSLEYGENSFPARTYQDDVEMGAASKREFFDYAYLFCDGEWLLWDSLGEPGFHPY